MAVEWWEKARSRCFVRSTIIVSRGGGRKRSRLLAFIESSEQPTSTSLRQRLPAIEHLQLPERQPSEFRAWNDLEECWKLCSFYRSIWKLSCASVVPYKKMPPIWIVLAYRIQCNRDTTKAPYLRGPLRCAYQSLVAHKENCSQDDTNNLS